MSTLTRDQFERVLCLRRGPAIIACGLSDTPLADAGPRAYLGDVIATALSGMGFWVEDPTNPTDAEVGHVANGRPRRQAFDLGELRLLETVVGNFNGVTYRLGTDGQDLSDFRKDHMAILEWKRRQVAEDYPELEIGSTKGAK